MYGVALLLQWPPRFTLELGLALLLVVLVSRLGGLGHQMFPDFGFFEEHCLMQPTALKVALEPPLCAPHARKVVEILYCLRPSVHSPSKPQWGSILLLVRALAPCSTPLL